MSTESIGIGIEIAGLDLIHDDLHVDATVIVGRATDSDLWSLIGKSIHCLPGLGSGRLIPHSACLNTCFGVQRVRLPSQPGMKPIRVVVADANLMACGMVSAGLKRRSQFEVVGYATSVDELLRRVENAAPEVALIGSTLQDGIFSGLSVLEEIHSKYPEMRLVLLIDQFGARGRGAGVPSRR